MYGTEPIDGRFIRRENRFAATVDIAGSEERVHVPNSGRMRELLTPGAAVLLIAPPTTRGRRTRLDLVAVSTPGAIVSVDSRVPNRVVAEALAKGSLPGLDGYVRVDSEYTWGGSRFDFHLEGPGVEALVEVKGCTLVEDGGLALFPDAPTSRGARHVRELSQAVETGIRSYLVVIVQREDGRVFAPNDRTDPAFGDALRDAASSGVEVMAFSTRVTRRSVDLGGRVPVDLRGATGAMT
jgi:sugar fermentation stimulation protein A